MSKRPDPRAVRFDLGDFVVDAEVASLLSFADVQGLVARHGRGDWGRVSPLRKAQNEAFTHPKNRALGSRAESIHLHRGVSVAIITQQKAKRRQTRLFLI